MGRDGAEGLLAMRRSGARTLGQDEATCMVYGMPRSAFEIGAVERQLPIDRIRDAILTTTAHITG
jgi:two-component system chemotaxis response regulator CheB